jgi:hypothetical protein
MWQDGSCSDGIYNYQTKPVTLEQGPINPDLSNPMPPTLVPLFQSSSNQVMDYGHYGHIGSIPTPLMGNEIDSSGGLGKVFVRDDDNFTPNLWELGSGVLMDHDCVILPPELASVSDRAAWGDLTE